jgi:hypothetical protein
VISSDDLSVMNTETTAQSSNCLKQVCETERVSSVVDTNEVEIAKVQESVLSKVNSLIAARDNENREVIEGLLKDLKSFNSSLQSIDERQRGMDVTSRDFQRLSTEVESMRARMTDIEHKCVSVESGNLLKDEILALKESISNLPPPRIIGGFKASESIQLFVAGCHPLSEGIISHLTKRFGGNVCDRQCVHIFSDSVEGGAPKNVADLSADSYFYSINSPNQSIGYDFKDNQSPQLTTLFAPTLAGV